MARVLTLVHLVAFAAYLGAGFAQTQLVKRSGAAGLGAAARDELERLAAAVATKIEVPAIFVLLASGLTNVVVLQPELFAKGWLHAKLTIVFLLLVLSHLEMLNARKIVKLRAAGAEEEIARRKGRHAIYGGIGALLVTAVVVLVTLVR